MPRRSSWSQVTHVPTSNSALEPGGCFELQDVDAPFRSDDGSLTEDSPLHRCVTKTLAAATALGRSLNAVPTYKDIMRKVGFVDIVEQQFKWPLGPWPKDKHFKDIGYWYYANLNHGLEGLLMALLTRGLGMSKEEVHVFCASMRQEMRNPRVHAYVSV